jgi:Domain of unknown function (DUF4062)
VGVSWRLSAADTGVLPPDTFLGVNADREILVIDRSAAIQPDSADVAAWLSTQVVFVSSVIEGMAGIRSAAADAIETTGARGALFERFGGRDDDAEIAYLSQLRQSTIYVGILAERYGKPLPSGYSATHAEYNEAQICGLRNSIWVSAGDHDGRQTDFINEISVFHTYGVFRDEVSIAQGISRRLFEIATENLAPWAKLGPVVFRTNRVRINGSQISIEATTRNDEVLAGLVRLREGRMRSGDLIFTHDLSSAPVVLADIATESRTGNSRHLEITLNRRDSSTNSGMIDVAFEGRTPEDLTELALRVALFGEVNPLGNFGFMANIQNPFEGIGKLGLSEEILGPIVRLLMTEALVASGRAERITSFQLGPVHRGLRKLKLSWVPRQRYTNVVPDERHIEGDVPPDAR